ncbi:MAG TPA: DNA repair protein RecO [Candidatus Saccharimonadales bacterium]
MKQFATQGIILTRTDFGEADRILTFITPDHGKVRAIAKGVRKAGAKLAGAIELFSVSELTVVAGRGEINTLISARLARHYDDIVKDMERTNAAYEFLRILNKVTEDKTEEVYFTLIDKALAGLNYSEIAPELVDLWFKVQLLKITGHTPNLRMDGEAKKLSESKTYNFDFDKTRFSSSENGDFNPRTIKFLRVGLAAESPKVLARVEGADEFLPPLQPLVQTLLQKSLRV